MVSDDFGYSTGYRDALGDLEMAIEDHMRFYHLHPASFMTDQLLKRIRTLRQKSFDIRQVDLT